MIRDSKYYEVSSLTLQKDFAQSKLTTIEKGCKYGFAPSPDELFGWWNIQIKHQSMNGNALAPALNTTLNEVEDWSQQTLPRDKRICGPPCKHKRRNAWVAKEIPKKMTV